MSTDFDHGDHLAQLRHERDSADRLYNDALTRLDSTIRRLRDMPPPPLPYDESQIESINEHWELLKPTPDAGSWLKRLRRRLVMTVVAPLFGRQQTFNAALVDHVNRNRVVHREAVHSAAAMLSAIRDEFEHLIDFQSKLVQFAQQITPYVDAKDRYVAALPHSLAAGISALGDELHMRWEAMAARERRYEAQVDEVRSTFGVMNRAILTIKRELERREQSGSVAVGSPVVQPAGEGAAASAHASPLDSYKYVGFEDQFRGSPQEIRRRMTAYVSDFDGASDVLDVGCGRGEFLDLLRERGISARGVDLNGEMAAVARDRGLTATAGDALGYLLAQPDASLGGLFSAQVVEHLEPDYLMRLLETASHKLRPGSKIILETINAACWYAFFSSYIRDITHVRPLHPDTLRYLLVASGFQKIEIRYSAPFPDESKLQTIAPATVRTATGENQAALEAVSIVNENMRRLNELLFTNLDYAVIGERL